MHEDVQELKWTWQMCMNMASVYEKEKECANTTLCDLEELNSVKCNKSMWGMIQSNCDESSKSVKT